jgi:pseudouridine-5'-phosphate glycosidase
MSPPPDWLTCAPEVADALAAGRPVVALESTLICHGLPWPANLETARKAEAAVRAAGAVPATVAVLAGRPTVGLSGDQLTELAQATAVLKASRRDLGAAVGLGRTAATTVSATMALAAAAGVRVFATGGIGGAHPRADATKPLDISADLIELSRTALLVVCAGAKSILDVPQTLELLETFGVPVMGYRTDEFPAFYVAGGGGPVSCRVETARQAADVYAAHVRLGGRGALLAQRIDDDVAVPQDVFNAAMTRAEAEAREKSVTGSRLTPYMLSRLAELTVGQTQMANQALIVANARLAAETAIYLHG